MLFQYSPFSDLWTKLRVSTLSWNGAKLGTEWLLSRRDRLIVARHEVPGIDVKRLRPGGTVEVIVSPNVSRIGSIVPLDGAIFLVIPGTSCLATIVLSLRDKTNRHRSASNYLRAPWVNPGWILLSPRDEEPSQTVLIFVPFFPVSPAGHPKNITRPFDYD